MEDVFDYALPSTHRVAPCLGPLGAPYGSGGQQFSSSR